APAEGYASALVRGVNAERAAAGLGALAPSGCAQAAAQSWAEHLASTGTFQHQDVGAVLSRCSARAAGENIARGYDGPDATVAAWMASPGHRANILDPGYTHIGSAAVTGGDGRTYAVHVFLTL
ncbi:MAG: CAP domain-containing protein, partial [Actinomycetota bacterium]